MIVSLCLALSVNLSMRQATLVTSTSSSCISLYHNWQLQQPTCLMFRYENVSCSMSSGGVIAGSSHLSWKECNKEERECVCTRWITEE